MSSLQPRVPCCRPRCAMGPLVSRKHFVHVFIQFLYCQQFTHSAYENISTSAYTHLSLISCIHTHQEFPAACSGPRRTSFRSRLRKDSKGDSHALNNRGACHDSILVPAARQCSSEARMARPTVAEILRPTRAFTQQQHIVRPSDLEFFCASGPVCTGRGC